MMASGMSYVAREDDYLELTDAFEYCFATCALKASSHGDEPRTYREAMTRDDHAQWHQAALEEMDALMQNGTWTLVELPPGRKAIGSRWVFKVKRNADGSIERYKARLVAKGFSQRPGFDYVETFAPTCKWSALRTVLAIVAIKD